MPAKTEGERVNKQTSFTPGPWFAKIHKGKQKWFVLIDSKEAENAYACIAELDGYGHLEEMEATARLIAAAPALLEAAQAIREALPFVKGCDLPRQMATALDKIHAAIAKAEGGKANV